MTQSTWISRGRRALQVATLFLAAAPIAFSGGQPVVTADDDSLIGHLVVTAARLAPASAPIADLGAITVTASRDAMFADLGAMTVTAQRIVVFARNEAPRADQASLL